MTNTRSSHQPVSPLSIDLFALVDPLACLNARKMEVERGRTLNGL